MRYTLDTKDSPARYMLEYDRANAEIVIAIEPNAAVWMQNQGFGHPLIAEIKTYLELPMWFAITKKPWGFGPVMRQREQIDGWPTWSAKLPIVIGRTNTIDWPSVFTVSATFQVILDLLSMEECPSKATRLQMLLANLDTRKGMAYIFASISPHAAERYLVRLEQGYLDLVTDNMSMAYEAMNTDLRQGLDRFAAWKRGPKFLYLEVPGDACGLGGPQETAHCTGTKLGPHNVDSPIQQLSLLAGMATLDMLFRNMEEMGG